MNDHKPTVFILHGDPEIMRDLRTLMESIQLPVEGYATAGSLLEGLDVSRPGCLILDVRMPQMSGIELGRRLRALGAVLPLIFVTAHGDVPTAVQAIREGAFDFLQRPFSDLYLLDRVRAALEKDLGYRSRLLEQRAAADRFAGLSPRERQVVDLIVSGQTGKAIAQELGVGRKTVDFHRANIMRKVKVETMAELVYLFFKGGWTEATHARAAQASWTEASDDSAPAWRVRAGTLPERRSHLHLMECGRQA